MTIAYLYHDLLNLYGENGNIRAIKNVLDKNNIAHNILYLSIDDELSFKDYDLVYIGSGTEANLNLALEHLLAYQEEIKKMVEEGKIFLITGNALDMFGKAIVDKKEKISALEIFDYEVKYGKRIMEEVFIDSNVTNKKIIGFYNHCGKINKLDYPLFKNDGVLYNNFHGTYVLGPILIRNPEFFEYFLGILLPNEKLKIDFKLENKAYETFVDTFYKETV